MVVHNTIKISPDTIHQPKYNRGFERFYQKKKKNILKIDNNKLS